MAEQEVKSIALFFLLAFLDEKVALIATRAVLKKSRKNSSARLKTVYKIFLDYRENPKFRLSATGIIQKNSVVLPNINLSSWRQFLRDADPQSLFPLIWIQIIKENEVAVASAMGVTAGTLRTRVGQTLEKLGGFVETELAHA
ncbi:MAG: hypothetical protein SGJ18_06180 [Pseudomonadota bacterium]|nr:hypothetical protein [Pseudomonadota bacterium]